MARGDQLQRHWNLLRRLATRGEGVPLRELAEVFDVSERTLQRDFEILTELGFPLEHQDDANGKRYWRLPHDFLRTGPLVINLAEALSLHLARHLLAPLAGTHVGDGFASLLEKIQHNIPSAVLSHFAALDQVVHVRRLGRPRYGAHVETIRLLTDAIGAGRSLEVIYRSVWRNDRYATRFDPYGLVYHDGDLFVCGWSHKADALRILKVTRIESAAPAGVDFERPENFDLEAQFRHTFGVNQSDGPPTQIAVKFTGPAAALVQERVWHESQRLDWLPSEDALFDLEPGNAEGVIATFQLTDVAEFKRWLKGFGDHCEVVRPDWLRSQMREELQAALRRYES